MVYLVFLTLFLFWVIPREHLVRFAKQRKPIERLGLICNYFTALLVLQTLLTTWKQRGIMLGALFVGSWAAFFFFLVFVYPIWSGMATFFVEPDKSSFDPTARQGRTVRHD